MADETKTSELPERITVLARDFTPQRWNSIAGT